MADSAGVPIAGPSFRAVLRGLTSAAVVWQVLWLISQPTLWPQNQPTLMTTVVISAVIGSAGILGVRQVLDRSTPSVWAARINAAVLTLAAVMLAVTESGMTLPDVHSVTELMALAAGIVGILVGGPIAVALTLAMATVVTTMVLYPFAGGSHFPLDGLIDPVYVLAVGLSATAARRALLRSASATDAAEAALVEVDRRRLTTEAMERSLRGWERLLHEQVLNTLVALARGGLSGLSRERMRDRCSEGARLLTSMTAWGSGTQGSVPRSGGLPQDLASTVAELQHAGVEVVVDLDDLDELPVMVRESIRTAVHEAMSNVVRHARARHVRVTARVQRRRHELSVDVHVVDDGAGLPGGDWEPGFGVQDAIVRPMAEVGGMADVRSGSEGGVEVVLGWRSDGLPGRGDASPIVQPSALAIPVLAALALYVGAQIAVTWGLVSNVGLDVLAAAMWAALASGVAFATTRGALTWPMVVGVSGAGWIIYLVQEAAFADTARGGWASPAIAALFLVVAATGPAWGWVLLTGVWLAFQGDPIHELTQPGTAMILVGAILGRSMRGNARRAGRSRDLELDAALSEHATRDRVERLSQRFSALGHSQAATLLRSIACGESDPVDAEVRNRAAREERYLRNVMLTDPLIDDVHRLVSDLVVLAHEHDVLLDVALAPNVVVTQDIDGQIVQEFTRAMSSSEPTPVVEGEPAGFTARIITAQEGDGLIMRMLVPLPPGVGQSPGAMVDRGDGGVEMWLWQTELPCGPARADTSPARVREPAQ